MRRTPLSIVLAAILALTLVGCSNQGSEPSKMEAPENVNTVTVGELSVVVPPEWEITDDGNEERTIFPDFGGFLRIAETPRYEDETDSEDAFWAFVESSADSGIEAEEKADVLQIPNADAYRVKISIQNGNGEHKGWLEAVFTDEKVYIVFFLIQEDDLDARYDEMLSVLDSITIGDGGQAVDAEEGETQAAPSATAPNAGAMTQSQEDALKEAGEFLDYNYYSYEGLIKILEYQGISHEDAVFAADNCGADWMEQAVLKARSYFESLGHLYPFELISMLENRGFTHEEAVFGFEHCGTDWNAQAEYFAERRLESGMTSRDEIIEELEDLGFTHEQAVHGVEAAGL